MDFPYSRTAINKVLWFIELSPYFIIVSKEDKDYREPTQGLIYAKIITVLSHTPAVPEEAGVHPTST